MDTFGLTEPDQGEPGAPQESGPEAATQGAPVIDEKAEAELVSKWWKDYERTRKFDENFRKQVAIDRRYAAGTADMSWAVNTNLIGAFIDILTSLLYARDPDVSVRKATQVDESGTKQMEQFARTLEIVISTLWKKGKLKPAARRGVRSVLSTAEGWFKCNLMSEKQPRPETEKLLNDAQTTHARLEAQLKLLEDPDGMSPEALEAEKAEKQALIESLQHKLEVAVSHLFVIDFVPTENIQVSADIQTISQYLDANWIANENFVEKEDAATSFPRLDAEDLKSAKLYYQRSPKELAPRDADSVTPQGQPTAEMAQAFTPTQGSQEGPSFVRVVELWDRRDKTIRTMIDGVDKWAKEPFNPPYPTSRFYPYFYFSFYEVDGERHPQSLSWRLAKLQDEYAATRSNFRITRERSIPGVIVNGTLLDATEIKKISDSKHQEFTVVRPSDQAVPIGNAFAAKPVAAVDMRVFDPTLILNDMERMSGVQEALSSVANAPGNPKTATEANIEQSGTNARTSADRDALEVMLTDLANYTAEQALQCLDVNAVQRMAGPQAFWPANMDIEDLFTMVEVNIVAGTTGKPRQGADQQAWATILPLIRETIGQVEQALASGNKPLADALTELIKETMLRLGDETDPDRFIPKVPPPGTPGAGAPPPPVKPTVSVALKGVIDPTTAAALIAPTLAQDAASQAPPPPAPGAGPAPGSSPPLPAAPGPAGVGPGAGP